MLTRQQNALLLYINKRLNEDGVSPSYDEMRDALDLKSKSGIHRLIKALEEREFIRRLPHRARALEVVRLPTEASLSENNTARRDTASPKQAVSTQIPTNDFEIPLYGRIAAGTPIEALRDPDSMVRVPANMLSRGKHYALEVMGDSMLGAGIMDGDKVIIKEGDDHSWGEIVVALVDKEEVTLKYLQKQGAQIALESANPRYETRLLDPERVQIQGRLVGLMRLY